MRLIDADALQVRLKEPIPFDADLAERIWEGWHECTIAVDRAIDDMPTIEPERKKGKWIHEQIESEKSITEYFKTPTCSCSICNAYVNQESNYCPNCGALMER